MNTEPQPQVVTPVSDAPKVTKEKLSRQVRRNLAREEAKKKFTEATPAVSSPQPNATTEQLNALVNDLRRVLNYVKLVDNHVWMLVETMSRKNMIGWSDVNETEQLYIQKEQKKQDKVKDLLSKNLSVQEYLVAIKEELTTPGWERFDINPIKDLNLNPFEVAATLQEHHVGMTAEDLLANYKVWGFGPEHFGIKTEEQPKI